KRINTYNKLEKDLESWMLDVLSKKERSERIKELEKLKKAYEWLKDLKKTPDVLFIIDWHYENLSLVEAKKLNIPSYSLLGSTWDIDSCTNFVPCNVNSIKSIKFILNYLKPVLTKVKTQKPFDSKNEGEARKDFKKPFVKKPFENKEDTNN
ncbi:MAG: 30S ribosomal protein S2, partial [uncultured bacterium (gcode 4)]